MTVLRLNCHCRYQKSVINIRVKLMSIEDPKPESKQQGSGHMEPITWSLLSLVLSLMS